MPDASFPARDADRFVVPQAARFVVPQSTHPSRSLLLNRSITIPNQSSVAEASDEFDDSGRTKPPPYDDRVVDDLKELVELTRLTKDVAPYLTDRCGERKEQDVVLERRVKLRAI